MTNPYNCGFTSGSFAGSRPWYAWYPTRSPEVDFRYSPLCKSQVAADGKIVMESFPLVVYSHGENPGNGLSSIYLVEHLARNGYIVFSTTHDDSQVPSFVDGEWDSSTAFNRKQDVSALIDHALTLMPESISPTLPITIMGHSLGGYTALAMCGALENWLDERLGVALCLSPYNSPLQVFGRLYAIHVPILIQCGGVKDAAIALTIPTLYEFLNAPKFEVQIPAAAHLSPTNPQCSSYDSTEICLAADPIAAEIMNHSLGFLNEYVKSAPPARARTRHAF